MGATGKNQWLIQIPCDPTSMKNSNKRYSREKMIMHVYYLPWIPWSAAWLEQLRDKSCVHLGTYVVEMLETWVAWNQRITSTKALLPLQLRAGVGVEHCPKKCRGRLHISYPNIPPPSLYKEIVSTLISCVQLGIWLQPNKTSQY